MKTTIDQAAAYELELYAENTGTIYEKNTLPTIRNLQKKYRRGQYDHEKAVKAWEYVAEAAAKLYAREYASAGDWFRIFNRATRRAVAEAMEAYYFAEYIEEA